MRHKNSHNNCAHPRYVTALAALTCSRGLRALLCIFLFNIATLSVISPAHALKVPRPIGPDGRIHMLMYSPDEVYRFTGHYGYQSSIIFADDEEIQTISLGDSVPWMINPSGNRIFLKPIEQDASTNMTVLTNRRSYLFELHAEEADSIADPDLIFILRFIYPSNASPIMGVEDVPVPAEEGLEKFNFNYAIRGSYEVAPVAIFDDGEFTYFEFRNKNATVPAFYVVDQWGNEAILNYRARDDYIVVEQVVSRFTLRAGGDVVCVYNESRPFPRQAPHGIPNQSRANSTPMPQGNYSPNPRNPQQGGMNQLPTRGSYQ